MLECQLIIVHYGEPSELIDFYGVYAAAYQIDLPSDEPISRSGKFPISSVGRSVVVSDELERDATQVILKAICEALNRVENIEVLIEVAEPWIVEVIEDNFDRIDSDAWRNRAHTPLLQKVREIAQQRGLRLKAQIVPNRRPRDKVRQWLLQKAKSASETQGRNLGSPRGGFGPLDSQG
jgi:hypothetical protein